MSEMKISYDGNYPTVEINFSLNEESLRVENSPFRGVLYHKNQAKKCFKIQYAA